MKRHSVFAPSPKAQPFALSVRRRGRIPLPFANKRTLIRSQKDLPVRKNMAELGALYELDKSTEDWTFPSRDFRDRDRRRDRLAAATRRVAGSYAPHILPTPAWS
jgi:hypothetical protein